LLDDPVPRIVGRAWIVEGQRQENWEFTLYLKHRYVSRADIPWELLPPRKTRLVGWPWTFPGSAFKSSRRQPFRIWNRIDDFMNALLARDAF
jgi:hypothetical protein